MDHKTIDQLYQGPYLIGYTVCHNDAFHHLQINGRLVKLSPTEYILCLRLLRHFERLQRLDLQQSTDGEVPHVYVSFGELQHCANLVERKHVTKHLSNANGKLKAHGITIVCVGDCGYTLDFR